MRISSASWKNTGINELGDSLESVQGQLYGVTRGYGHHELVLDENDVVITCCTYVVDFFCFGYNRRNARGHLHNHLFVLIRSDFGNNNDKSSQRR